MGEHTTEPDSLSGKSWKWTLVTPRGHRVLSRFSTVEYELFFPLIFCESLSWVEPLSASADLFPWKNTVRLLCLSRVYRMDVLHPLNQTPLGFLWLLMTLECVWRGRLWKFVRLTSQQKPSEPAGRCEEDHGLASLGCDGLPARFEPRVNVCV